MRSLVQLSCSAIVLTLIASLAAAFFLAPTASATANKPPQIVAVEQETHAGSARWLVTLEDGSIWYVGRSILQREPAIGTPRQTTTYRRCVSILFAEQCFTTQLEVIDQRGNTFTAYPASE